MRRIRVSRTDRLLRRLTGALLVVLCAHHSRAQSPRKSPRSAVLEFHQGDRTIHIADSSADLIEPLSDGRFQLKKPARVQVHVVGTNTALYVISDSSSAVPTPPPTSNATDPLVGFLVRSKSYF